MVKRIGIAGAAGSGKTTAASYLVENHGFKLLGFATPLYKLGEIHNTNPEEWHPRIYGWAIDNLEPIGYDNKTILFSFTERCWEVMKSIDIIEGKNRTLLQTLGTEVGRALDEDLWTKIFEAKVEELGDVPVVNDNLRFPNELKSLERLGFVNIFLDTPVEVRARRYEQEYGVPMNEAQLSHTSEAYLDEISDQSDFWYRNRGEIDLLHRFLDEVVDSTIVKLGPPPDVPEGLKKQLERYS